MNKHIIKITPEVLEGIHSHIDMIYLDIIMTDTYDEDLEDQVEIHSDATIHHLKDLIMAMQYMPEDCSFWDDYEKEFEPYPVVDEINKHHYNELCEYIWIHVFGEQNRYLPWMSVIGKFLAIKFELGD